TVVAWFDTASAPGDARKITATRRSTRAKRRSSPVQNRRKTLEIGIAELRTKELALVAAALDRSFQERKPVFVEVRGVPGAGKTRLRRALVAAVRSRREVDWLIATMSRVGEPAPLSIITSASSEWYEATMKTGRVAEPVDRN